MPSLSKIYHKFIKILLKFVNVIKNKHIANYHFFNIYFIKSDFDNKK